MRQELKKIAIFGMKESDGSVSPTHAARQLESGEWTSKLGKDFEDIPHTTLDALNGPVYGSDDLLHVSPSADMTIAPFLSRCFPDDPGSSLAEVLVQWYSFT